MTTAVLVLEISKLPWAERLRVVEKTLQSMRQEKQKSLAQAADALYDDYRHDPELTAFTALDTEPFYEAR